MGNLCRIKHLLSLLVFLNSELPQHHPGKNGILPLAKKKMICGVQGFCKPLVFLLVDHEGLYHFEEETEPFDP